MKLGKSIWHFFAPVFESYLQVPNSNRVPESQIATLMTAALQMISFDVFWCHNQQVTHDKRNKTLPPKLDPCLSAINWMLLYSKTLCRCVAFDRKSAGKFVRITEMNDNDGNIIHVFLGRHEKGTLPFFHHSK